MSKSYHNTKENPMRIFVCEECRCMFTDDEIRKDISSGKWGHICKAKKYKEEHRCEAYFVAYKGGYMRKKKKSLVKIHPIKWEISILLKRVIFLLDKLKEF